jgi:hypothetical protein
LIEFICVDGAIEVEAEEKGSRVERCDQRNRASLKKAFFLAAALVSFCRYTKRTLIHVMAHGLFSLILTKYTAELFKMNRKKNS